MTNNALFAVVLAAGASTRFGSTKQLAILGGESLVGRAVRAAESACGERTILVVGNDWQNVAEACTPINGFMVLNPKFADGMGTSIAAGVRSVRDIATGVLILLADQPLVCTAHLAALVQHWEGAPDHICVSAYADTQGPPVIFPAAFFTQLMALQADRGARAVLDANREKIIAIQHDAAAVDIDRPADLNLACQRADKSLL